MPIDIKVHEDDYILYEIICDYCDKEYTIKYMLEEGEKKPKESIECCPFCSNLIEEPAESIDDEENSWD